MKGRIIIALGTWMLCGRCIFALNPALDINQYAHNSWKISEGAFKGTIYSIAQTPDGYLWLGTEFGMLRFDGNRSVPWQPPAGQHLPGNSITKLLAVPDGTLWIGTDAGLASWNGAKLSTYPELDGQLVAALIEDREGTVWVGGLGVPTGRLCAMRRSSTQCGGQDGALGQMVLSLYVDSTGNLWAGAQTGLWRWKPGSPTHYAMPPAQLHDLNQGADGELLIAMPGGIQRLVQGRPEPFPLPGFRERFNANRLLRDRDGGFWIGTLDRGLIHIHRGRTDVFSPSDGLSGNIIFSLFEDREGNVWAATNGGLDRFREFAVTTISVKQGLSTDNVWSVLAAKDGSVWIACSDGLNRWKNGRLTVFRRSSGLPDEAAQSLFEDDGGRLWAFARHGLAYFADGRFVPLNAVHGGEAHFIVGDKAGDLWISEQQSLLHLRAGRLIERVPWSKLGRQENASALQLDRYQDGIWLGFWRGGGVAYFKDNQVRAAYTAAQGLGERAVAGLELDQDGSLWVATEGSGLGWIKDGRVATLTTRNGLPCDTVHWTMEDDDHSLWLYTACGLVRVARTELAAWIANPKHKVETTVWDAVDGVRLRSTSASAYSPRVAKAPDGKLWFVTGNGLNVVDPSHLARNKIPPPVYIEQVTADRKVRWQNVSGVTGPNRARPALTGDLQIDYTALSFVAPEKIHFKYKLEGKDLEWQDAGNRRQAFYTNLPPAAYRFRVIACNDSGIWNEAGTAFDFSITPAFYQTSWFRGTFAATSLLLLWGLHRIRVHRVAREVKAHLEGRTDERLLVARELHDTLLSSFQGLLMQFQAARNLLRGRAEDVAQVLDSALVAASQAITEARDTVQDMRSSTVITNELAEAVEAIGKRLAEEQRAANEDAACFSVHVEGTSQALHPILRDEVYRITTEALRNAFRHARARRIEVEIRYDARRLRVRVRDDGTGMDPSLLKEGRAGHWGLPGMRERAREVGGCLEFRSEPGAGTQLELIIPASVAYRSHAIRRFRLFKGKSGPNS